MPSKKSPVEIIREARKGLSYIELEEIVELCVTELAERNKHRLGPVVIDTP